MSQFSGKCDIYDTFGDASDEFLQNSKFYIYGVDGRDHLLDIKTQKDLAKYYPYLTSGYAYEKNKGAVVRISSQCFIDSEEKDFIMITYKYILRYYNKCKRNKIPYSVDDVCKKQHLIGWLGKDPAEWEVELAHRIGESGDKASIEGLHRPMQEYYRDQWFNYLLDIGYEKDEAYMWVYGWRRYLNELKKKESESEDI